MFAAPSVLFFTLTGAVQLFSWHEAHGNYHPPVVVKMLSSLHKDQVLKRQEGGTKTEDTPDDDEDSVAPATFALKVFFFLVAIGVTLSTCFGVWMGLTQTPRRGLCLALLLAGTLLPVLLLAF